MKSATLRIGEVAARSGVSIDAVRFYERRKLLPLVPRTEGGFRLFSLETIERVRFIKQAQEIGFSLDEIAKLLTAGGAAECQQMRDLLCAKLTELDERIRRMREFRRTFSHHLAECERELTERGKAAQCPVVAKTSRAGSRKKSRKKLVGGCALISGSDPGQGSHGKPQERRPPQWHADDGCCAQ